MIFSKIFCVGQVRPILAYLPIVLVLASACKKQPTDCVQCNDPVAKNYNPNASGDTTCCIYRKAKPEARTKLVDKLSETSGLLFANNRVWTHNDSGGAPELYAVDTTNGAILQTVVLDGATNVDWESITRNETYFFVGDMGNNRGDRKNLRIYRFPLAALESVANPIHVSPETIAFTYSDQTDFTSRDKHTFDCEAFVYYQNQFYLFTKNWADYRCNLYTLSATPGTQQAQPAGSFDARGLITGADLSPSGQEIVLVGYRGLEVFLWQLLNFSGKAPLAGDRKLVKLGDVAALGQMDRGLAKGDLAAVVRPGLTGLLVPKADSAADMAAISAMLDGLEAAAGMAVGRVRIMVVATETPAAMFTLGSYAPAHPRLVGLTWGAEDPSPRSARPPTRRPTAPGPPYRAGAIAVPVRRRRGGRRAGRHALRRFPRCGRAGSGLPPVAPRRLHGPDRDPPRSGRDDQPVLFAVRSRESPKRGASSLPSPRSRMPARSASTARCTTSPT